MNEQYRSIYAVEAVLATTVISNQLYIVIIIVTTTFPNPRGRCLRELQVYNYLSYIEAIAVSFGICIASNAFQ